MKSISVHNCLPLAALCYFCCCRLLYLTFSLYLWFSLHLSVSLPLIALNNSYFVFSRLLTCHFHDVCYFRNICYFRFFFVILVRPPCPSLKCNCCYSCCCRLLKLYLLFSLHFSFESVLKRCFDQYISSAIACISEDISDSNGH